MMVVRSRGMAALVGVLAGLVAGCGGGDGGAASVARDSAGIRIVESTAPAWQAGGGEAWRVDPEPVVDIGVLEGDEAYQLFRVTGARRLSDGRIVVANSGTHELRFYGEAGTFLQAAGRQGGGPGEFERVELLGLLSGDTIVVYDDNHNRVSYFGPDGVFLDAIALTSGEASIVYRPLGMFADGTILVMQAMAYRPGDYPGGVIKNDIPYARFDPTTAETDSLGVFPGPTMYGEAVGGSAFYMTSLPFAPSPSSAAAATSFFFGNGDGYVIREYGLDGGLVRVIRRPVAPRPVTAEAIETVKAERLANASSENWQRRMERMFAEAPLPETMPAYAGFVLADDGGLWVRAYELPGGDTDTWTVFDPDGRMLGDVALPEGFRVTQVGADFVLGQWQDDLEVEHVRMYGIEKPEGMEGS